MNRDVTEKQEIYARHYLTEKAKDEKHSYKKTVDFFAKQHGGKIFAWSTLRTYVKNYKEKYPDKHGLVNKIILLAKQQQKSHEKLRNLLRSEENNVDLVNDEDEEVINLEVLQSLSCSHLHPGAVKEVVQEVKVPYCDSQAVKVKFAENGEGWIFADDKRLSGHEPGAALLQRYRKENQVWVKRESGIATLLQKDKDNILNSKKLNVEALQFVAEFLQGKAKPEVLGGLNDPGTFLEELQSNKRKVVRCNKSPKSRNLQFHLLGGNHWVLTTLEVDAAGNGNVLLWDSLGQITPGNEIMKQVHQLYNDCHLRVMQPVKQTGSVECGYYSVAYALGTFERIDPEIIETTIFDFTGMGEWLVAGFENASKLTWENVPKKENKTPPPQPLELVKVSEKQTRNNPKRKRKKRKGW